MASHGLLRHDNHVISLPESSSNTIPSGPLIVALLGLSGVLWRRPIFDFKRLEGFNKEHTLFGKAHQSF